MINKIIKDFQKFLKNEFNFSSYKVHEPDIFEKDLIFIKNCIKTKNVSAAGSFGNQLENEIKKITKSKYVILTNSGTSALHISCVLMGIKKNDEVLLPAFTFVAPANVIKYCNAITHFIDIEPKNFTIDFKKLEDYLRDITIKKKNIFINKKTGNPITAIIPVHPFGHPCDMKSLNKISKKYNLKIIEDAADALGSYYLGKHVGTFGSLGVLSFNGNKIITAGAGGAVLTNSKKLADRCRHLVSTAKVSHSYKLIHDEVGYNYRMPNLNAALALSQLKRLKQILYKKRKLYNKYLIFFQNKKQYFQLVSEPKFAKSNYWLQTLLINNQTNKKIELIIKKFIKNKIFIRSGWELISSLKPFKDSPRMSLKTAKKIQPKIINIPSSSFIINK